MNNKLRYFLQVVFKDPKLILKILKSLFMSSKQATLEIYQTKKKECPNKSEIEYLRYILLTKPPFDYQSDELIGGILKRYKTIEELSDFIEDIIKVDSFWKDRAKNIKIRKKELEDRNGSFLWSFYNDSKKIKNEEYRNL